MNRAMLWSIRRELWENRAVVLAPVIVAFVILFSILVSNVTLPQRMHRAATLHAVPQRATIEGPFDMAAGLTLVTAFIVAFFYCLDALHSERRDRSILFWKSLPVSDKTTVLSKASIPLVVLPILVFTIVLSIHIVILFSSTLILSGSRESLAIFWTQLKFVQLWIAFAYSLVAISLWHAPLYAWLLLVSAWARRAAVLWAIFPFLAIGIVEKMIFRTDHFFQLIKSRVIGWFPVAFLPDGVRTRPVDPLDAMTPATFLSTPGLWIGLIVAVGLLAAAIRLRRNREPL